MKTNENSYPDTLNFIKNKQLKESFVIPECLNFGMWIWYSVEDRLLFSNSFYAMTGLKQESFYDFKTFFEIVHGCDLLQFLNDIEELLNGAPSRWVNFRIVRPDMIVQEVNCFMESLKTEFGEVFDITGVCFKVN